MRASEYSFVSVRESRKPAMKGFDLGEILYVVRCRLDPSLFLRDMTDTPNWTGLDHCWKYQSAVAWTDAEDVGGEVLLYIQGTLYRLEKEEVF